jgi:hypothetical protein
MLPGLNRRYIYLLDVLALGCGTWKYANSKPCPTKRLTFYIVHYRAYAQYSKGDPTDAQCYRLFTKLCLLVPQHVSANSYAIIRGYYYKLRKMCIKYKL